jgi:hypothetical protein
MKFSDLKKKFDKNWNSIEELKILTYAPLAKKYDYAKNLLNAENSPLINSIDGVAVLNRMENEVATYFYLCCLYTNIEFENTTISDEDYDFFAQNKFKDWLRKKTQNDAYDSEQMLKNCVIDEIRRLNSTPQQINTDEIQKVLESLSDPKIEQLLKWVGKEDIKDKARELVERDKGL